MKSFAIISSRRTRIVGHPHSGWRPALPGEAGAIELDFKFEITDDGAGNFLFAYSSFDGSYVADSWHETLDEAYTCALESYGIERADWSHAPEHIGRGRA
jgi:hypothetical protein